MDHEEGTEDEEVEVYRRQVSFALKQAETGTPVAEVIRLMDVSEQTFCKQFGHQDM